MNRRGGIDIAASPNDVAKSITALSCIVVPVAALFTHVTTCIDNGSLFAAVAGTIFFPAGFVHGISVWMKAFAAT